MNDGHDIKRLLARAFGPEPPLALDREEVFTRGQRRVRARRLAASSGVAASVVAVVVGAVALSGLGAPDDTGGQAVPGAPTSTVTYAPVAPVDERRAAELTEALTRAGLFPSELTFRAVAGESPNPPAFRAYQSGYRAVADVVGPNGEGSLIIQVRPVAAAGSQAGRCDAVEPAKTCQTRTVAGVPMAVRGFRLDSGEVTDTVQSVRPDGVTVWVRSSNVSMAGAPEVSGDKPPVDVDLMARIAALPGLTY